MDFINIIGTIFDNSINHVVALANQIKDLRLNKNQQDINEDIYQKIQNIDNKQNKSKGYYSSLQVLQQAIPNPEVGDWAVVHYGNSNLMCVCDTAGTWTLTEEEYEEEIPLEDYIKKTELKTINNQSLIGDGNIEITGGGGGSSDILVATADRDGLMPKESYSTLQHINDTIIPGIQADIRNLEFLIGDNSNVQEIIEKYRVIKEFIDSLENSTEGQDILNGILQQISSLRNDINQTLREYKSEQDSIKQRLLSLEENGTTTTIVGQEKYRHQLITQSRYNALTSYEKNTLYLITDFLDETSVFGDTFPLILGGDSDASQFGDTFPFVLGGPISPTLLGGRFPITLD